MNTTPKVWQKSLFTFISGLGLTLLSNTSPVQSQIIPDRTLGQESSKVTPTEIKDLIEGGAIRGNNLFHSFTNFNVNNNQQVYFSNPVLINNIITRVTGNNISNIFGTLGVDGNANLFLINPNGIIFGKDATLDVKGSFLASTAPMIKFADGTVFNAQDTSEKPLLTMSVPVGMQWGNNPSGDIINYGNLTTVKDLSLSGQNVNIIESSLQSGGNLILAGQEKVIINDSVHNSVILKSAGDIDIQGNQTVQVKALNNFNSNFTANTDIIFRSPIRLLGNGRYTTGGYFITEDLNNNIIDFIIPHNNVIKVNGDVTLADYTGSSLYILASGKVTLGNVTINNVNNNSVMFTFISDGKGGNQPVAIRSKNDVKILDVRAGIDTEKIPGILKNNPNLPSGFMATFNSPTGANITVNNIVNNGGNVLLTNQYKFNSQLSGNITIGNIDTSIFDGKNGGAIALSTSQGNITTDSINSSSSSTNNSSGTGGAIALLTNTGNITVQDINTYSSSTNNSSGTGGAIALSTSQGNITTDDINSSSVANNGNSGKGGEISLTTNGNITTRSIKSDSTATGGHSDQAGNITIIANTGKITTTEITAQSFAQPQTISIPSRYNQNFYAGSGGNIKLISEKDITTNNISSDAISFNSDTGNGGEINIKTNANITTDNIYSQVRTFYGTTGNGGNIILNGTGLITTKIIESKSLINYGKAQNGGNIEITNNNGSISLASIDSSSFSEEQGNVSNGGNINLTANGGGISALFFIKSDSTAYPSAGNILSKAGKSGDINLTILNNNNNDKIVIPYINSSATGKEGNSGAITIKGTQINLISNLIKSDGINGSNGGQITVIAPEIKLIDSDISSSSFGSGKSGTIDLITTGNIELNNSRLFTSNEPGSTGLGGNINIQTKNIHLSNYSVIDTGTYSEANAGNININAENVTLIDSSSIRSLSYGIGKAGQIFLNVKNGEIFLNNSSNISTAATKRASGNSGNIYLFSQNLSLLKGSQIQALTEGIGTSKAGEIIINTDNNIIISGLDPNFTPPDLTALPPDNVRSSDYYLFEAGGGVFVRPNMFKLIQDIGTNQSINTAQKLTANDTTINPPDKANINVENPTRTPYISIFKNNNNNIRFYELKVNSGTRAVFDVDSAGVDTKLTILNSQGEILASNDDAANFLGAGGSNTNKDPYLRYTFNTQGTYYVQLSHKEQALSIPTILNISLEPNPISANLINEGQPSGIFAYTTGAGNAGNILLNTNNLKLESSGSISAFTSGIGSAGNILINGQNLQMQTGEISASTTGAGKAGNIHLKADHINLENEGKITATTAGGLGGNINIIAKKLFLNNGSQFLTTTSGNNAAGDINIQVQDLINLTGENTGFFADTAQNSTGNGGNITIDPIAMNIENRAAIAVNSQGTGIGGKIFLQSGILLLNNGLINAQTLNSNGGEINLAIGQYLLLANNSKITSTAGTLQSGGNGGNVQINAPFIMGFSTNPNHQIIANAFTGKGGNILINTNGIFGTEYIDIQASSQSGPQGIIEINTPGIDATSGLTKLPSIPIDLSGLIDNSCRGLLSDKNSFTITGKGGVIPSPTDLLTPEKIWQDWVFLPKNINQESALTPKNFLQKK
jgi:filamentous hemagglutinin family protein